jgi:hypothetical protein
MLNLLDWDIYFFALKSVEFWTNSPFKRDHQIEGEISLPCFVG